MSSLDVYFVRTLRESLLEIREDLHMDNNKNALMKLNETIMVIDEQIISMRHHQVKP